MSLLFGIGFAKPTFPLSVIRPPEMPEIRFEAKDSTVAVLDGYCSVSGKSSQQRARILSLIEKRGGDWSIGEIAKALGMEKSTISARVWECINETGDLIAKPSRPDRVSGVRVRPVGLPSKQLDLLQ